MQMLSGTEPAQSEHLNTALLNGLVLVLMWIRLSDVVH